jgi:putative ABC transport system permease protein
VFFVLQEKSYNSCYKNFENTYLVVTDKNESFVEEDSKETLINKFPQILSACRYYNFRTNFLFNHSFFEGQLITTDEGFFDVFSVQFINGDKKSAFSNQGIVLTESFAEKIFGSTLPLGQTIKSVSGKVFQVTAIVKDLPENSSISGDCFIYYKSKIHQSGINNVPTTKLFIVVYPEIIIKDFEEQVSNMLVQTSKILNNNIYYGEKITWKLRAFKTSYFDSDLKKDQLKHADLKLIFTISFISLIILLLAIINYINLTTAEGITRIKEIGVRKTSGASKVDIVFQLLIESLITCGLASILAFLFTPLLMPIFERIFSKQLHFIEFTYINISLIILSIFLLGIFSGLFPALVASKYSPIQLMQQKEKVVFKSSIFRNTLNIFQFSVSIIFTICLILILKQIQYSQNRDIGFDTSDLIHVDYHGTLNESNVVKELLRQNPKILNVSFSKGTPIDIGSYYGSGDPIKSIGNISSDDKFLETFKLRLLVGRNFNYPSEIKECVITENAFKEAGWKDLDDKIFQNHKVVGVINNFDNDDLHVIASNVMITNSSDSFTSLNIKIMPGEISASLDYIKQIWTNHFPDTGFRYSFYDDWVERSFLKEKNQARIVYVFGILSIILSCLGLYGLTSYYLMQRVKEIGLRRITGARISEIFILISLSFLKWIFIPIIIACPISIYISIKWLNNFAYKTTLDWWIFILSGLIMILIAFITISWRILKAVRMNPAKALKYE